jgi:Mn2+/Fe2+ NRAMP family transporter
LALVLVVRLILINDQEVMGHHVNAVWFNSVAWASAAVMIELNLLLLLIGFG